MKREQIRELARLLIAPAIAAFFGVFTAAQFIEWMATAFGIATLVPIIVEQLKVMYDLEGKVWKILFIKKVKAARFLTWTFCIVGIVLSHWLGWGFQNIGIWSLVWNGLICLFIANGYYKLTWVQVALAKLTENLEKLKELIPEKPQEEPQV
jgi:hypothetical protein